MRECPNCQRTYSDEADFCPRDGSPLASAQSGTEAHLAAGLARSYRIIRRLGGGGMGAVFLAEQIALGNRPVALKILLRKLLDNPEFLQRFHNEAASTARIRHPNVITVHELGQSDDGSPYISMEYLEGETLGQALQRRGALPVAEVIEIVRQIARGLNAAHKLDIIHRDLKPDNIFLAKTEDASEGTVLPGVMVKIMDFGIARLRESSLTLTGTVLGTPAYMSFEQASGMRSEQLDVRSDIYSLGIVVYEMLTGRVPFCSDTPLGYVQKHVRDVPPPFKAVAPSLHISPGIERVVMKALRKPREERQSSVLEFARELAAAAEADTLVGAQPVLISSQAATASQLTTQSTPPLPLVKRESESAALTPPMTSPEDHPEDPRPEGGVPARLWKRSWLVVVAAISLALALIIGVVLWAPGGGGDIKIGVLAPLSDPGGSPFGVTTRDAALLAIEEWNAKGGVLGKKIVAVVEDSQCKIASPDPAVDAANKLIDQDKVHYLINDGCGAASVSVPEIANSKKVILINTNSDPGTTVTEDGRVRDYIYRNCSLNPFQGTMGAKFALETLKAKTAFVMHDPSYSRKSRDEFFEKTFVAGGGKIVGKETYNIRDTDFSKILAKVAAAKPDIIYLPDSGFTVTVVTKLAREKGIKAPFVGDDAWADSWGLDRKAADGGFFTMQYSPEDTRPEVKNFVKAFGAKYAQSGEHPLPDTSAALAYDATNLILQAIKDAGADDTAKVKTALDKITFNGVTGKLTFDSSHNPVKSVTILAIKDNKIVFDSVVNPRLLEDQRSVTSNVPSPPPGFVPLKWEFVRIPAGEFEMGCSSGDSDCLSLEKPQHHVRISKGFEMGKYPVTQAMWKSVMGTNPSRFKGADRPVERVSWNDVQKFLQRINTQNDGYHYRLPTEAEWEYAARAGSTSSRYGELNAVGWYWDNSGKQTHPVGQKQPNAWGLYDMLGNVWQWVQDWYSHRYYTDSPGTDPQGPSTGDYRVLRGNCWNGSAKGVSASVRVDVEPSKRDDDSGFRCVREPAK